MSTYLPGHRQPYASSACRACRRAKRRCKEIVEEQCEGCRRRDITCEWELSAMSRRESVTSPSASVSSTSSLVTDELSRLVTFQLVTSYLCFPFPYNIYLTGYNDFPKIFQDARGRTSEISPLYDLVATTFLCSEVSCSTHRAVIGSLCSTFSLTHPDFANSFTLSTELHRAATKASLHNNNDTVDLMVAGLAREPIVSYYQDRLLEQWVAMGKVVRNLSPSLQLMVQDAVSSALASSAVHRPALRGIRSHLTQQAFRFLEDSRSGVTLEAVRSIAYVELSIYAEADLPSSLQIRQLDILFGEHLPLPVCRPWIPEDVNIVLSPLSYHFDEYRRLSAEVEEERLGSFYLLARAYRRNDLEGAIPGLWAHVIQTFRELDRRVVALTRDGRFTLAFNCDPPVGPQALPESSLFIHAFLSTDQNCLECLAACHRRLVKAKGASHPLVINSQVQLASTWVIITERIKVLLAFAYPPKLLRSIVKSYAESVLILEDILPPGLVQDSFTALTPEHQIACFRALYLASFFSPVLARLTDRLRSRLFPPSSPSTGLQGEPIPSPSSSSSSPGQKAVHDDIPQIAITAE